MEALVSLPFSSLHFSSSPLSFLYLVMATTGGGTGRGRGRDVGFRVLARGAVLFA